MKLKFVQINIYMGKYLDALLDFLKKEKPDFISMQEVTYGDVNLTGDTNQNLFEILKEKLQLNEASAILLKTTGNPEGAFGNVVLTPHKILKQNEIILNEFRTMSKEDFFSEKVAPTHPKKLLDALVEFEGQKIHAMSVHGAWTAPPKDTKENLRQAKLIADYLKSLGEEPFILGGDMNMPPETGVIKTINKVANNLILGTNIKQTTHPTAHRIAPRGFLVDYVFVSKHFKPISVEAPLVTVSDHLPIVAELEFNP
ncbi:MAG TPA: endonuclease/exonuclease/phosphatase family protein [archaeon]|nr:endonuclease/exonuclease/phosphatase family protein [archaeon]